MTPPLAAALVPLFMAATVSTISAQAPKVSSVLTDFTEEPAYQAVCQAALAQPLPADATALADQGVQAAAKDARCDEQQTYYGFGKPPDYPAALHCAYQHRVKQDGETGSFVDGPGTLAMLYANGYAVARSYPLAIRFACELGHGAASAETELRIGRLQALRDGKLPLTKPFDLCDDATSGTMGSLCAWTSQRLADIGRTRRLEQLRSRLPQPAQPLFSRLQAAESTFEKARGENEYTGGGGSGSSGFVTLDQGQLREQFLINLHRFAAGDLPIATAASRAHAEQQMQDAAKATQASTREPDAGPRQPTPQTLAATQQAWQALFATWMRFVPVAYPQLSPDAAATELFRLRIHQLKRSAL